MCSLNGSYCENEKSQGGSDQGLGGGSKVWGRWVMWGMGDVNQE